MSTPRDSSSALLLLEAHNSSEAIERLYRFRKAFCSKVSLAQLCRKAAIPSSGYLSDVMHGRKCLHPKHAVSLAAALGLTGNQEAYFVLLVDIDHESNDEQKAALEEHRRQLARVISIETLTIPKVMHGDILLQLLLLSSFSLFPEGPTLIQLSALFSKYLPAEIKTFLDRLQQAGLVREHEGRFVMEKNRIIFRSAEDGFSHLAFLQEAVQHAAASVNDWYSRRDEALFSSTIITVRRDQLPAGIARLRAALLKLQGDLDADRGDDLLHFNVQVYPHTSEK